MTQYRFRSQLNWQNNRKDIGSMRMELNALMVFALIALVGCNPSAPPTSTPTQSPSEITAEVVEPTPTAAIEAQNLIRFDEMGIIVGFDYPEGFNQGIRAEIVESYQPQVAFEFAYPPHARILFTEYAGEREDIFAAGIRVFRAADIDALQAGVIDNLFAVLLGQLDHYSDFPKLAGAASVIDGQLAKGVFRNGNGYRFLNSKSFDASSLISSQTNYLYQGITNDENYFVSVVFVINAPFLTDLVNAPLTNNEEFENYFQIVQERVKNAKPNDFQPSLTILDSLVSSIIVIEQ